MTRRPTKAAKNAKTKKSGYKVKPTKKYSKGGKKK